MDGQYGLTKVKQPLIQVGVGIAMNMLSEKFKWFYQKRQIELFFFLLTPIFL